jgi:hypothetical protein
MANHNHFGTDAAGRARCFVRAGVCLAKTARTEHLTLESERRFSNRLYVRDESKAQIFFSPTPEAGLEAGAPDWQTHFKTL